MNSILKNSLNYTRKNNLKNLKDLSERLSDVEYFVFFGTLLGYCREGNIIENDDDIDFYVNIREKKKIINILQELGFSINIDDTYFVQSTRLFEDVASFSDFYFYEDDPGRDYLLERWNFLAQPYNVSKHLHVPKKIVFPLKQGE
ncbi:LicD family protein, partial [bacterium]|nr:LicD family protein [bacterium]